MCLCKWWQDVREERVADDDEHDVGCDHTKEESISRDGAKARSAAVRRCGGFGSRTRYGGEHDQRECGRGDRIEHIENLERAELLRGCDDEAGDGRASTDTEVARDTVERERGRSLLGPDQPDDQRSVRCPCGAEPGSADNRAGKALPGTLDEGEAGVANGARQASCDHEPSGGAPVEQRSRRRSDDCGRPHGRRENQSGCRRREAPDLVQIDDLKGNNEPVPEEVEGIPPLKDENRAREPGAPTPYEA